jgi:hypothetical protein
VRVEQESPIIILLRAAARTPRAQFVLRPRRVPGIRDLSGPADCGTRAPLLAESARCAAEVTRAPRSARILARTRFLRSRDRPLPLSPPLSLYGVPLPSPVTLRYSSRCGVLLRALRNWHLYKNLMPRVVKIAPKEVALKSPADAFSFLPALLYCPRIFSFCRCHKSCSGPAAVHISQVRNLGP